MNITFRKEFDWAVLPEKKQIVPADHDNSELYSKNFRWVRQYRKKELCLPWRAGNELGWYILSPIDVTLYPVDDVELHLEPEELESTHRILGFKNLWKRDRSYISVPNDWMKLYQFRSGDQSWDAMFLPNGQGSVEWRQGFSISIPDKHSLLVMPIDSNAGVSIPFGLLTKKQLDQMSENGGVSLAVVPREKTTLTRGQPVARIILVSNESICAKATYE